LKAEAIGKRRRIRIDFIIGAFGGRGKSWTYFW